MTQTAIQKLKKESMQITELVTGIKARLDSGHYDFMSWKGRASLLDKIEQYRRYANEPYRSSSAMGVRGATQKRMEMELRAILNSTY